MNYKVGRRREMAVFLVVTLFYFATLHQSTTAQTPSEEYTENGTRFYNVTGALYTREENPRDIVDPERDLHREIARNLSHWFQQIFDIDTRKSKFSSTVTVIRVFLWPSDGKIERNREGCNVSFVLVAQNHFMAAPSGVPYAEMFVEYYFQLTMNGLQDEIIVLDRFQMNKTKIMVKLIREDEVNITLNVLNNYMKFITKLSEGTQEGQRIRSKTDDVITIISYIGITLSIAGLLVTLISICYFRRLRKFRGNQILVHICSTIMAGMLFSVASFTYEGRGGPCTIIAILLHYFILSALCWMCVEAHNLYRDLVKVFNTNILSSQAFFLRACLFAYGIPTAVVGVVVIVDVDNYGRRNDACWMTSLAFVISFLVPVLLIVSINIVFFVLIMREIVQVSQRDAHTIKPSLRAAISLSVLLGFCWLFAGISTFSTHDFFQYAFVIMSSFQGLYIFLFHGIGKKELRDSWKSLSIFNWRVHTASSAEGRGKTESTQDTIQVRTPKLPGKYGVTFEVRPPDAVHSASGTPQLEIPGGARSRVKRDSCNTLLRNEVGTTPEKTGASDKFPRVNVIDKPSTKKEVELVETCDSVVDIV